MLERRGYRVKRGLLGSVDHMSDHRHEGVVLPLIGMMRSVLRDLTTKTALAPPRATLSTMSLQVASLGYLHEIRTGVGFEFSGARFLA